MIAKVHRVRIASLPPLEVDAAYLRPSQWRHIDLNRALFAQSGGGRVDGSNDTEISPNDNRRDRFYFLSAKTVRRQRVPYRSRTLSPNGTPHETNKVPTVQKYRRFRPRTTSVRSGKVTTTVSRHARFRSRR